GNINKSTVYDCKKMFDEFMGNWYCRINLDSWNSSLDLLAGWQPCQRKQEDAGLAHGGLPLSCGGVGGGGLASQLT
ncbi:MAG: hypothetical protein ACK56I_22970, partial [bacterium]